MAAEDGGVSLAESSLSGDKSSGGPSELLAGAEPEDLVYSGPVRVCGACDVASNDHNPFYTLVTLPKKCKMHLRRYRPWNRCDSHGFPESKLCQTCVFYSEKAFKAKGGKKYITQLAQGGGEQGGASYVQEWLKRVHH